MKIHIANIFKRAAFALAVVGILFLPAIADFAPQSPAFPHGTGLVRQAGGCSASTDNKCQSGLSFPSFNNFTDSTYNGQTVEGVTDERRFLTVSNRGASGTETINMTNTVSANVGDVILTRAYVHNNGTSGLSSAIATGVKLGMDGFTSAGSNVYYSAAGTSVTLRQFTSATNSTPALVSDDVVITSASGKPIKIRFYDTTGAISTTGVTKTINQANFFTGGASIGDVKGCYDQSFYVWTYFKVVSAEYDLDIKKYVGKDQAEADTKVYTGTNILSSKAGDNVYYRIDYSNLSSSSATPVGTKVYDDYDQTKLDIMWLPTACSHDGNKITCNATDLAPGQSHTFYYIAKIKADVLPNTVINNAAEVKPTTDEDINPSNDTTNAQVRVMLSAVCGDAATTYPEVTTAYPSGTVFCSKGTAEPATPAFPALGQTITWTCKGVAGGTDASCQAKRSPSSKYDLKIDKYVGKTQAEADAGTKSIVSQPGDTITYKLAYSNLSTSAATPVGTRIYDDYDQTKLTITWLPSVCTNDGDKITCVASDLQPSQSHIFYYNAQLKAGVESGATIINNVEIKPLTDNDTNQANDTSSATVTINVPVIGTCGTAAKAYTSSDTAYPSGTTFCASGNATPTTPAFPAAGATVSWTCNGIGGGSSATCSATKPLTPVNGECGTAAKTYTENDTAYPSGTTFCASGNSNPTTPIFPNAGSTITWSCDGINGGTNKSCSANKPAPTPLDITITKSVNPIQTTAGSTVTYTLKYKNLTAGTTATNVVIKDFFDNTNIDKSTLQYQVPAGVTCMLTRDSDPIVALIQGDFIQCTIGGLAYTDGEKTLTYTAKVKTGVAGGTVINNVAKIAASNEDPTKLNNNTATATITVNGVTPAPVCGTAAKAYASSDTAYPSGTTFCATGTANPTTPAFPAAGATVTWSCTSGTSITCSATKPTTPVNGECGTAAKAYTSSDTAYPSGTTFCATGTANPATPAFPAAGATVTWSCNGINGGTNKSCSANKPSVVSSVDVTIAKSVVSTQLLKDGTVSVLPHTGTGTPESIPEGIITYALKYKNLTSGVTATNVVVKDFFDNTNIDKSSIQFQAPSGVTCIVTKDSDPAISAVQGDFIQCTIGNVSATDGEKTITYTAKLKSTANSGTLVNNVAKIAASNEDVTKLGNNTANASVKVNGNGVCGTAAKAYEDSATAYPSGTSFCLIGTANPTSPAFPASGAVVTWSCNGINGGTNATCSASRGSSNLPDVTIAKSAAPTQVLAGGTITYTLKYKNLAAGTTANGVTIKDFFDIDNLDMSTLQFQTPAGVTCSLKDDPDVLVAIYQAKYIHCDAGTLSYADGEKTITYTIKVKNTVPAGTIIKNTARISATNEDQTKLTNNTSSATVTVIAPTTPPTTPPSGNPVCGTAAMNFGVNETAYPANTTFCNVGVASPTTPAFPAQGATVSWTCTSGTQVLGCTASRTSNTGGGGSGSGGGGCSTYSTIDLNITKYVKTAGGEYVLANSRDGALQIEENKENTVTYKVVISNGGDASAYDIKVSDSFSSESGMTQSNISTVSGAGYADGVFTLVQPVGSSGKQEFVYTATVKGPSSAIGKNTAKIESFTHSYKCPIIAAEKGIGRSTVAYVKSGGVINPSEGGYQLLKSADKQAVKAGEIVTYTLTLKNTGDIDMKDVVLSDRFPVAFLEPTEEFASYVTEEGLMQFKQRFLPAGADMVQVVKMKVKEGTPKGTEIKNTLTAKSLNVPMDDTADAQVMVGESTVSKPLCPAGYWWDAKTNKCKKKVTPPKTPTSGPETPFIALGLSFLGLAIFLRRRELAKWMTK